MQKFFTLLSVSLLWASCAWGQVTVTPPSSDLGLDGLTDGCLLYDNSDALGCSPLTTDGTDVNIVDSGKITFGTGDDASIYYDGTDLRINPQEVGSGIIRFGSSSITYWDHHELALNTSSNRSIINANTVSANLRLQGGTTSGDVQLYPGDSGNGFLFRANAADTFFNIRNDDDASNYEGIQIGIDATNNDAEITAVTAGTGDDDIDILLTPAGTGRLQYGVALNTATDGSGTAAFTANMIGSTGGPATTGQNGWMELKDNAGNTMWVPVWK